MSGRRALVEGLKPTEGAADPKKEKAFVFGEKEGAAPEQPDGPLPASIRSAANGLSRVPMSTRMRADFSAALKRASLERQLAGIEPNTLQDILEQAVEPWLRNNGYLK